MTYRTRPGEIVEIIRDGNCMWAIVGRAGADGFGVCTEIAAPYDFEQLEEAGFRALHGLLTALKCGRLPVVWRH